LSLIKGVSLALAVMGGRKMSWLLRPTMIAVVGLILASGMANADCMKNGKGDAVKDINGVPRCEGQCERASVDYCEATPAGSATD
jgi:hypothetical protein